MRRLSASGALFALGALGAAAQVTTASALVDAVDGGAEGDVITVAAGRFELAEPLRPKPGMVIRGAGVGETVLAPTPGRDPGDAGLPDGDTDASSVRREAYLIDLGDRVGDVTIAGMTLLGGDRLHGAITCNDCDGLDIGDLRIENFTWSGVRTFRLNAGRIHDIEFHDAGGKVAGKTGGGLYFTWARESEIWNNSFTKDDPSKNVFGIKGHQFENIHIHHNTILVSFSIEVAFGNDEFVEIDHNVCDGVISIPKYAGGPELTGKDAYHIHHNYMMRSYSMEWARNGVEVDHNLFDFALDDDKGNLISDFGRVVSPGPTRFHNNLIKNPGRGLFWSQSGYDNYSFYNNHVIANATATPRVDGLFGFSEDTDFGTIVIRDNVFELSGVSRPLLRNEASYGATVVNNTLVNVSDGDRFDDGDAGAVRGPTEPLGFDCGQYGEYRVDGWVVTMPGPDPNPAPDPDVATAPDPDTYYHLENRAHDRYLQATNQVDASGEACGKPSQVVRGAATEWDGTWTQWRFAAAGDATYYVTNRNFSTRLQADASADETVGPEHCGGDDARVTRVADASCADGRVQWALLPADDGYYYVYNETSDTYLQALPPQRGGYAPVRQAATACDGLYTQWKLRDVGAGALDGRNPTTTSSASEAPTRAVQIFPNPTPGRISVTGLSGDAVLYDVLGQEVLRRRLTGERVELEIAGGPGVYTLLGAASAHRIVVE